MSTNRLMSVADPATTEHGRSAIRWGWIASLLLCIATPLLAAQQHPQGAARRLELKHPPKPSGAPHAMALSPDGRWLAVTVADRLLRLWDLTGAEPYRAIETPPGFFTLAFSGDGQQLFGTGKSAVIRVWNIPSGSVARDIPLGSELMLHSLVASADGKWLAAATESYTTLLLWDLTTDAGPQKIQTSARPVFEDFLVGVAFSPDSRLRATANRLGKVRVVDVASGDNVASLETGGTESVAFSRDGRWLVAGHKTITLWDTRTWKPVRNWESYGPETGLGYNRKFAFSPDGKFLAGAGTKAVRLWEIPSGRRVAMSEVRHRDDLRAVLYSPTGRWFATAASDGMIGFWDGTSGRLLASLATIEKSEAWAIASADGYFDGSSEGIERIIGWLEGDQKFPASHHADAQVPGLLAQIASGKHTPRTEAGLERVRMTTAEAQARFMAPQGPPPKPMKPFFPEGASVAGSGVSGVIVQSFDTLVEVLRRPPLYGGSHFSADALRKIFDAAGCDPANVLAGRIAPDTGVVFSYDSNGRQKAILNIIRPTGLNQFPLIYVNPTRVLYSPESGVGGLLSPLVLMRGGTILDSDLGVYKLKAVSGTLFGFDGNVEGLEGQAGQLLVFERGRLGRGAMFSKSGKIIHFFLRDKGIAFPMEELEALEEGDTLLLPGSNGAWWRAEIRAGPDASGVIAIAPTRARLESGGQEQDVVVDELKITLEGAAGNRTAFVTPRAKKAP